MPAVRMEGPCYEVEAVKASVFVSVGNATQGFRRLLDGVDHLAGEGILKGERVLVQSGNNSDFRSLHCTIAAFLPMEEFEARILEADFIISHAGAGTLFHALLAGKTAVVMPRRRRYGEHVDDHQVELAHALAVDHRVIVAWEVADLPLAIMEAKGRQKKQEPVPRRLEMIALVAQALGELTKCKAGWGGGSSHGQKHGLDVRIPGDSGSGFGVPRC